jgi:hypothetical protein
MLHQQYMADIAESSRQVIDTFATPYFVKYGANVWATFQVVQSVRLDSGYGWQVHP